MSAKSFFKTACLISVYLIALLHIGYADDRGWHRGRRDKHYKYRRYYPQDYYFRNRIYYSPGRRFYFYFEVYPQMRYYHPGEKDIVVDNPNYLPLTSIANMASQGVPDAVIIAEIEKTRSVYKLNSQIITYLKQNGASDRLIDYMLQTSRKK